MCDLDCTDLAWDHITLLYGGDCGDIIVINSNNNLLTTNHVLCEPEWLVFLNFSWFVIEFIKVIKVWINDRIVYCIQVSVGRVAQSV